MIASDIHPSSIASARDIVRANDHENLIDVRHQRSISDILDGVLRTGEMIDFAMCNLPFCSSREAFQVESARKMRA